MKIRTERKDGVVISTIKPQFMAWYGNYETAVYIDNGDWRILEGYETAKQAMDGHNKYENMSKQELMEFDYIG